MSTPTTCFVSSSSFIHLCSLSNLSFIFTSSCSSTFHHTQLRFTTAACDCLPHAWPSPLTAAATRLYTLHLNSPPLNNVLLQPPLLTRKPQQPSLSSFHRVSCWSEDTNLVFMSPTSSSIELQWFKLSSLCLQSNCLSFVFCFGFSSI